MIRYVIVSTLSCLLLLSHAYSQNKNTEFPAGWKPASVADYSAATLAYNDNHVPNHAGGDFDGDGISDEAWLLVNASTKQYGVFVFFGQKSGGQRIIKLSEYKKEKTDKLYSGISSAKPGQYETICGKGYGGCQPDELKVLKLKHEGIYSFDFEGAMSVYYWEPRKKEFSQVWLSD